MEASTSLLPRTRRRYAYEVRRFLLALRAPVQLATPQDLVRWQARMVARRLSSSQIRLTRSAVKHLLAFLVDIEEDEHAAVLLRALERMKVPRDRTRKVKQTPLDDGLVLRILGAAGRRPALGPRDLAVLHLMWATGARRGDAVSLRVQDVDLSHRAVHFLGKGAKERDSFITPECAEDLALYAEARKVYPRAEEEEAFFLTASGNPLQPGDIWYILDKACKDAGITEHVRTHQFRYTRITQLLERGMRISDVALFAGHSNPSTTLGYYNPEAAKLREGYDKAMRKEEGTRPVKST